MRVTANDGGNGEQYLREFDNEKTIPTVLTTSQKLSTGVDARNIRNIVLMRPINSMIEFKQIIGRGTRLFDGKEYFTIYDFVDAYHHFARQRMGRRAGRRKRKKRKKTPKVARKSASRNLQLAAKSQVKDKIRDGKEREIQHMIATSFWGPDGKPISIEEFLKSLYGALPAFFKNEDDFVKYGRARLPAGHLWKK